MPHIAVDLERLKMLHCGLGQLSLHLGRALAQEAPADIELTYFLPAERAALFAGTRVRCAPVREWHRERFVAPLRPLLARVCRGLPIDLWHATHQQTKYLPLDPRTPVLLTLHDLNCLREQSPAKTERVLRVLQREVDRAAALTTGSHFAADEIRTHLNLRGKPLHVIYHGALEVPTETATRPAFVPDDSRPLLFAIGDITPKKNFHVLVEMLALLPHYRLVIAGNKKHAYAAEIERRVRELKLEDRVCLPGRISDGERYWLYVNCQALVFPSLTEGFGLPVVEAMSVGRPVFVSHATSLPEVAGPLGFYWHSYEPDYMARVLTEEMQSVARDPDFGLKLRAYAAQFNWQRAAREYLSVYREMTAGRTAKAA